MRLLAVFLGFAVLATAACDNPYAVLPASFENRVDTVEMYAVNGTDLSKPSGYLMSSRLPIRLGLDITSYNVDFVYRLTTAGAPEFAPYGALAPNPNNETSTGLPGFQGTTTSFDAIVEGEQLGYQVNAPIPLEVGKVFYLRSGVPNGCYLQIPYYAKLEVLSFDAIKRSVKFKILVNINCGYRALTTGVPKK